MKRRTDLDRTVRITLAEAHVFHHAVEGQGKPDGEHTGPWLDACDDMDRIVESAMPDEVEVVDQHFLVDPRRIEFTGYVPPNGGDNPDRQLDTWTIRLVVIGEEALVIYAKRFYGIAALKDSPSLLGGVELATAVNKFLGHSTWYAIVNPHEDNLVDIFDDQAGIIYQINVDTGVISGF